MMMGPRAPSTAVIEFATGSAFGMQVVGGSLPFFDPYGWTPDAGIEQALAAMGWTAERTSGGSGQDALRRLAAALAEGPVFIGPVEMGYLTHQPGRNGPIGADHFVVVLAVGDGRVLMHDPEGHPYASLPVEDFIQAWQATSIDYASPFTMRTRFQEERSVAEEDIIRASLHAGLGWLSMSGSLDAPPGSVGNGEAARRLADMVERNCGAELRDHLIQFAVRVGARRTSDAAACLWRIGHRTAAGIMAEQARLIGSLQHPLVVGDDRRAAATLRALSPTYAALQAELG
jgi:hypothetical protein